MMAPSVSQILYGGSLLVWVHLVQVFGAQVFDTQSFGISVAYADCMGEPGAGGDDSPLCQPKPGKPGGGSGSGSSTGSGTGTAGGTGAGTGTAGGVGVNPSPTPGHQTRCYSAPTCVNGVMDCGQEFVEVDGDCPWAAGQCQGGGGLNVPIPYGCQGQVGTGSNGWATGRGTGFGTGGGSDSGSGPVSGSTRGASSCGAGRFWFTFKDKMGLRVGGCFKCQNPVVDPATGSYSCVGIEGGGAPPLVPAPK